MCRTHRRRTQNYIQELEKEVLRLRAREAEMQSELESRSSSFSSRSQSAGLPSPSSSISSDHSLRPIKDISITIEPKGYAQFEPEYSCTIGTALEPTPAYSPLLSDFTARISDMSIKDAGTCTGAVCGLNAQAAINFVLGWVWSYHCVTDPYADHKSVDSNAPASHAPTLTDRSQQLLP